MNHSAYLLRAVGHEKELNETVQARPYCLECGYSLHGLTTSACPECGRPFSLAEPSTFASNVPRKWYTRARRVTFCVCISFCLLTLIVCAVHAVDVCSDLIRTRYGADYTARGFDAVRPGMNEGQVLQLIGLPLDRVCSETEVLWHYSGAPRTSGGYHYTCVVRFDRSTKRVLGRTKGIRYED